MQKALLVGLLLILATLSYVLWLQKKEPSLSQPTPATNGPVLELPQPGTTIVGPLVIRGMVPKSWTFEGQFQMRLEDSTRKPIFTDSTSVPADWTIDQDLLPFVQSYNFHTTSKSGFLVLENDNPSGLPENRKSIEIPINFSPISAGTFYLFDQATGNPEIDAGCQVVLPRAVHIPLSKTPIKDTLNLLAKSMHPDFFIKGLNLTAGRLTVEFPEIPGFTTGGSCAQNLNRLKVEKTVLQFPEVKEVKIIPDSIFQP